MSLHIKSDVIVKPHEISENVQYISILKEFKHN